MVVFASAPGLGVEAAGFVENGPSCLTVPAVGFLEGCEGEGDLDAFQGRRVKLENVPDLDGLWARSGDATFPVSFCLRLGAEEVGILVFLGAFWLL